MHVRRSRLTGRVTLRAEGWILRKLFFFTFGDGPNQQSFRQPAVVAALSRPEVASKNIASHLMILSNGISSIGAIAALSTEIESANKIFLFFDHLEWCEHSPRHVPY